MVALRVPRANGYRCSNVGRNTRNYKQQIRKRNLTWNKRWSQLPMFSLITITYVI